MSALRIRPAGQGDRPAHLRLLDGRHAALAARDRLSASRAAAALWPWKYGNPWRPTSAPTVLLASAAGSCLGALGYVPLRMKVGGREARVDWLIDMLVAPGMQGSGLGGRLTRAAMSRLRNKLVLGVTPAGKRMFLKHGFDERPGIGYWQLRLTPAKPRSARALRALPVVRFPEVTDSFFARASAGYDALIVRDSRYLNWRYRDIPLPRNPYRRYLLRDDAGIRGVLVLAIGKAGDVPAFVKELFVARDDDAARAYGLAFAQEVARESGGRALSALVDESCPEAAAAYRRAGFLPAFQDVGFVFHLSGGGARLRRALLGKGLHLSAGDSDLGLTGGG